MITESEYSKIVDLAHRKKFAQFFTPEQIAIFMSNWVLEGLSSEADVLEPAFGLGVFSRTMCRINPNLNITGYDIDNTIFHYALSNFRAANYKISLSNEDYLVSSWTQKYDAVICNPPYLKFHDYDNATLIPLVNKNLQTHLNGFTNIYTLFLLKSVSQLKEYGKLAYIIPSEFLNSDYGVEVKRELLKSGTLRHVIIVDFNQCAFDDALTTACVLLCQKIETTNAVTFSTINNMEDLSSFMQNSVSYSLKELDPAVKWKQYYEQTQASNYSHLVPFSTFAKVSRGIATGANDYFTFSESKKELYNIPNGSFRRCICHAVDVKNLIFTDEDFIMLSNADKVVYLFDGCADSDNSQVRTYIQLGEDNNIHKRHLTSKRSPWYALENRTPAPIWVSVFNRKGLRFVRNVAQAYNLTTFHCVYNISEFNTNILFAYLITDMAKEIFLDNSRQYGNGLVKFEPNDLNRGKVADLRCLSEQEKHFVLAVYDKLQYFGGVCSNYISLLDRFFREKYSSGKINLNIYLDEFSKINQEEKEVKSKIKNVRVKQLSFMSLFEQYGESPIVDNGMVHEDIHDRGLYTLLDKYKINISKKCLVSLVKTDNLKLFQEGTARIYYTGKKFPATVALDELYYFTPYLKGKGIRDLYFIKMVRIGTRKEGQIENDSKDFRLVFEIEYVGQLYEEYKLVELKIWRTFTSLSVGELLMA